MFDRDKLAVQPSPDFENEVTRLREATVVHVASLTVHADEVIVGRKEEKLPAEIVSRYRWNAARLAAVAVLVVLWFNNHLQSWATQKIVFGTATAWALVQLIRSLAKKDFASDIESTRKRLLAHEGTRENLLFALVAVVALLGLTSSLYVRLGDREQTKVRIDVVDADGNLFMDSLSLEPGSRLSGRLFLPRFTTKKLTVLVRDPPNYVFLRNPIELKPWSAVELTFGDPTQFMKKRLHALRIVPGWTLNGINDPSEEGEEYEAVVRIGKDEIPIHQFKFSTLYLGVEDQESLERIAREQTNEAFTDQLKLHLAERPGSGDDDAYVTDWRKPPVMLTTRNFDVGETVVVSVGKKGSPPSATTTPRKIEPGEITTIFIERTP